MMPWGASGMEKQFIFLQKSIYFFSTFNLFFLLRVLCYMINETLLDCVRIVFALCESCHRVPIG